MSIEDPHHVGFTKLIDNPKITEATFRRCLDAFITAMRSEDGKVDEEAYSEYLSVTVNEYSKVDVVDNDTGEVLFWAPPLKYKPDLADVDIHKVVREMELHKLRSPNKLPGMAENALQNLARPPKMPQEDVDQWNMIYAKYGYIKESTVTEKAKAVESVVADEDDEW